MCNNSSKECSQSSSAATVDLYADTFVAHPPKQKLSYAPELGNYESIRHVENLYSYDRRLMTGVLVTVSLSKSVLGSRQLIESCIYFPSLSFRSIDMLMFYG